MTKFSLVFLRRNSKTEANSTDKYNEPWILVFIHSLKAKSILIPQSDIVIDSFPWILNVKIIKSKPVFFAPIGRKRGLTKLVLVL